MWIMGDLHRYTDAKRFRQSLKKSHDVECLSRRRGSPHLFLKSADRAVTARRTAIKKPRETTDR